MTLGELAKVYHGRVILTALALHKATNEDYSLEYYSFRTIGDFASLADIPEFYESTVKSIVVGHGSVLFVDIVDYI